MIYATQNDIVEAYSEDALYVADRDGDGVVDAVAVSAALARASEEIDSYIAVRYPLPLAETPGLLKGFCIDIALYRLASTRNVVSEEHRQRYEDAIKHLEKIAKGIAALPVAAADGEEEEGALAVTGPRPIVVGGPERLFTREKMRGL